MSVLSSSSSSSSTTLDEFGHACTAASRLSSSEPFYYQRQYLFWRGKVLLVGLVVVPRKFLPGRVPQLYVHTYALARSLNITLRIMIMITQSQVVAICGPPERERYRRSSTRERDLKGTGEQRRLGPSRQSHPPTNGGVYRWVHVACARSLSRWEIEGGGFVGWSWRIFWWKSKYKVCTLS